MSKVPRKLDAVQWVTIAETPLSGEPKRSQPQGLQYDGSWFISLRGARGMG